MYLAVEYTPNVAFFYCKRCYEFTNVTKYNLIGNTWNTNNLTNLHVRDTNLRLSCTW